MDGWVAAILGNGLGRYADAATAGRQASQDMPGFFVSAWALPELVEAAARTGDARLAAGAVNELAETTQPSGTDWGLVIEARCRALVSESQAAEGLYREAIDRLGRTRLRPELARAHLLYGEWLRRENRRTAAREQLRTAHELLSAIGMETFAERARHELLATGETARKQTAQAAVEASQELTAQEAQVAQLAPRRPVQPGDRRPAVHQLPHRPVPPAQGLHQARHQLPRSAPPRSARRPGQARSLASLASARLGSAHEVGKHHGSFVPWPVSGRPAAGGPLLGGGARRHGGPEPVHDAVLISAAALLGGFVSGSVARIVKSWPDRSWPADQGTARDLCGRDGPAPSLTLRSVPTGRRPEGPAAITSEQETKQYPDSTVAVDGLHLYVPRWEGHQAGRDATGRTGTPKEKEKRS